MRRAEIEITEEKEQELRMDAINNMRTILEAEHIDLAKAHIEEIIADKINNLISATENIGNFVLQITWN